MVIAFGFILTYLVSQLCGVAHGNGKKRKLLDDDTAQMGLMVSSSLCASITENITDDFFLNSTGSFAKSSTHFPQQPSRSVLVSSSSVSPSTGGTSGLSAGS
jgi:hypothetical protein